MHLAKTRVIARHEALIIDLYAEVARSGIGDYFPRVSRRVQELPNEFVLTDPIGPGHFDHVIYRLPNRCLCHGGSNIICCNRLHQD